MVLKKLDNRLRVLIENGVAAGHRSLFVVVGARAKDQVVILHHILTKATYKARPSVLWCYKKELGFSSHRKKRMRQLQKKLKAGKLTIDEDDPFELFISSTTIRYCYYADTHKVLGQTFGMLVLQDFEALTPNLLARTIETIEGGGVVVLLLQSIDSVKQLQTLAMDVHARYRTEAHDNVVARFNERFLLSLTACRACLICDDQLNILPLTKNIDRIEPATVSATKQEEVELKELKESLQDSQPVGALVSLCRTVDQAKAVLQFLDVITEKTLKSTVALTAARGRGKSAALGLAVAGAVGFNYSNIFVTSPSPENLKTLFEFICKGFDALEYQEHIDYEVVQSTNPEFNKAVVRINVTRDHRQTIQYIHPTDAVKLGQAELLVVDEAAAIPLPLVRQLLGPYLVFLSSTINGYEGTGRSLSLKLIEQLRNQAASTSASAAKQRSSATGAAALASGRSLRELTLEESIRYRPGDQVEAWLNRLLCLETATSSNYSDMKCPSPNDCELYYVCRDTLFSCHTASEEFLQKLMSIYVSAHYKNSPNDLQMISDAPQHALFCLFGPLQDASGKSLPNILCVVQVCLEGQLSRSTVEGGFASGRRAAGDLLPWTVSQQFQDYEFASLCGARVVRIATHPDYQNMGYGSRALKLLHKYYEGLIVALDDEEIVSEHVEQVAVDSDMLKPRSNLPPLFLKLSQRPPERLDYIGVSYGLTSSLLKFWKRAGYTPVYVRQTPNDLTGEHSCIMLKRFNCPANESDWLAAFYGDFRRRFARLLSYQFRTFAPSLTLSVLKCKTAKKLQSTPLSRQELALHLSNHDLQRLELYSRNLVDHHLITDLLPVVAMLFVDERLAVELSVSQTAILASLGLQHLTVDEVAAKLDLPVNQVLALFNRTILKIVKALNALCASDIESKLALPSAERARVQAQPTLQSLQEDLREAQRDFEAQQAEVKKKLFENNDLSAYNIRGGERDWEDATRKGLAPNIVSVKAKKTKKRLVSMPEMEELQKEKTGRAKKMKVDKAKKRKSR